MKSMEREQKIIIEKDFSEEVNEVRENQEKSLAEKEMQEASELFGDLINQVSSRYEGMPDKMRENFIAHNSDILKSSIEFGMKKGFSDNELKALELSAILHDVTKNDSLPEVIDQKFKKTFGEDSFEYKRIEADYRLLIHGKTASQESMEILSDEFLVKHSIIDDFENIREIVSRAIAEHMGPNPGYMGFVLEATNKKLKDMGETEIVHPRARGKVSEVLLAADMKSLASEHGICKVISIRYNFNQAQDRKVVQEYKDKGVNLTMGEAALLSAIESANQARDMISDLELKMEISKTINEAMGVEYKYGEEDKIEILNCEKALQKQRDYLRIVSQEEQSKKDEDELEEVRTRLREAA